MVRYLRLGLPNVTYKKFRFATPFFAMCPVDPGLCNLRVYLQMSAFTENVWLDAEPGATAVPAVVAVVLFTDTSFIKLSSSWVIIISSSVIIFIIMDGDRRAEKIEEIQDFDDVS